MKALAAIAVSAENINNSQQLSLQMYVWLHLKLPRHVVSALPCPAQKCIRLKTFLHCLHLAKTKIKNKLLLKINHSRTNNVEHLN